jgi:hypothetical protein
VTFGGLNGSGSSGSAFHGAMGGALARERAGRPLESAAVLEGLADHRRLRRLQRRLAIARFFRFVR